MNLTRNIWAVGRNYADHASEMKADIPTTPLIFLKSGDCLSTSSLIKLPNWSTEIHHELELALWMNENLQISHISLAIDLSARDAQLEAKKKGLPWTMAKSFKESCPMGPWVELSNENLLHFLKLELKINGVTVQQGLTQDMIFNSQVLLAHLKNIYPVQPYDVILTGTPSGVGPLRSGDKLQGLLFDVNQSQQQPILNCHWDVN